MNKKYWEVQVKEPSENNIEHGRGRGKTLQIEYFDTSMFYILC